MQTETIYKHLSSLEGSGSSEELRRRLGELSRNLGFDGFVFALKRPEATPTGRFTLLNGYPEPWIEHYFSNDLLKDDPVIKHCNNRSTPLDWLSLELAPGSKEQLLMNVASEFGLRGGVSCPLHGPHGEFGVLSFSVAQVGPTARASVREALPVLPLLAAHLREMLIALSSSEESQNDSRLSRRELECLKWAADGKTSWEIGQIMSLSERTVNFHLGNVNRKLGVKNRQHAVAKALLSGLFKQ